MFFDRDKEKELFPSFTEEQDPPQDGLWEVILTDIPLFKKSKKGTVYLNWPIKIVRDSEGNIFDNYKLIDWMLFFQDQNELADLLLNDLKVDESNARNILTILLRATFLDGKEPVQLTNVAHDPIFVELSPGFSPAYRTIKRKYL
jgi:hypothetical protein